MLSIILVIKSSSNKNTLKCFSATLNKPYESIIGLWQKLWKTILSFKKMDKSDPKNNNFGSLTWKSERD